MTKLSRSFDDSSSGFQLCWSLAPNSWAQTTASANSRTDCQDLWS